MRGQEFVDAVDRMLGDAGQDLAEIGQRFDAAELAHLSQAVDDSGAPASGVRAGQTPVLPTEAGAEGAEAGHHRRAHRVGAGEGAEEERPTLAKVSAAAVFPSRDDATDVLLHLRRRLRGVCAPLSSLVRERVG